MGKVEKTARGRAGKRTAFADSGNKVLALSVTGSTMVVKDIPDLVAEVFRRLGGKTVVGIDVTSDADFVHVVERGLPLECISRLMKRFLSQREVDAHIIPRRTLTHRKAKKERLTRRESERVLRITRIVALAERTFANAEKAHAWLRRPTRALGGRMPLDLVGTEVGGRLIENLLYRIAHGVGA